MSPPIRGSSISGDNGGLGGPFEGRVPTGLSAPGEARRLIQRWLHGHPRADDATLAVSETVTNAVRHGDMPSDPITVRLSETGDGFRVEVTQSTFEAVEPPAGFPGPDRRAGRGLAVVESLADRWGVIHGTPPTMSTTVWFEM